MSEMVERVARAICLASGDELDREGSWSDWWAESPYADMARAAIEAMHQPSQAMELAGRDWARSHDPSTFADIFDAMITEALK